MPSRLKRNTLTFLAVFALLVGLLSMAAAEAPSAVPSQIDMSLSQSIAEDKVSLDFQWVTDTSVNESEMILGKSTDLTDGTATAAQLLVPDPAGSIPEENISNFKPIHVFSADIEGLDANTVYYYKVGSEASGYSEVRSFKSPALDSLNGSFSFLVSADTQGKSPEDFENTKILYDYLMEEESDADFLLHTGDVVEDGYSSDQWQYFFDAAQNLTGEMPIMATTGNHDGGSVDEKNVQYRARLDYSSLKQPQGLSDKTAGTVYAFEYGDALFVCLNSYADDADYEIQKQFLLDECKNTDKAWKIVFYHHSTYDPGASHYGLDNKFGKLMTDADVDIVFNGHEHGYARTTHRTVSEEQGTAGIEDAEIGQAPTYVTGGSVYNYAYSLNPDSDTSWNDVFVDLRKDQSTSGGGAINAPGVYARVDVTNNALTYTAYYKATGEKNPFRVIDTFTILKQKEEIKQPAGKGTVPDGVTFLFDSFQQEKGRYIARFNWVTDTQTRASQLFYAKKADFEQNDGKFTDFINGSSFTVDLNNTLSEMNYTGMNEQYSTEPLRSHKAETGALEPDTEYVYAVGDGSLNMTDIAAPAIFKTPKADNSEFSFNWFTDEQHNAPSYDETLKEYQDDVAMIMQQAFKDFPGAEFILSNGDQVNYGFDTWEWDAFFEANKDLFSRVPLYLAVGNHEFDGAGNEWVPEESWDPTDPGLRNLYGRYNPPKNGAAFYGAGNGTEPVASGMDARMFEAGNYFVTYKDTLFLFLDYKDQATDEWIQKQQEWLKSTVKQNPARWRIAVLHKSLFGYRMDKPVDSWTEAMDAAGIDVVLMGHDHVYVRTNPYKTASFTQTGDGTTYITNASSNRDARGENLSERDPKTAAYMAVKPIGPGYANITVTPDEIRITAKGYNDKGELEVLEDNALITNKPRTYDLSGYQFPEAAQRNDELTLTAVTQEGYPKEGQTLASAIAPEGATAQFQWERSKDQENWEPIEGATDSVYTLGAADVGSYIRLSAKGVLFYNGEVAGEPLGPVSSMTASAAAPIEIASAEELAKMAENFGSEAYPSNGNYKLTGDIDMQSISMQAIGSGDMLKPFFGTFDGQGHTVSNMTISSEKDTVGFIAYLAKGAVLANVTLANVNITGAGSTGGLAGASAGTIRNCSVQGNITGGGYTGGLAGTLHGGILANNVADAVIICKTGGGLVGGTNYNGYGSPITAQETSVGNIIMNNLALGSITGEEYTGALVGDMGGSSGCPLQTFNGNIAANEVKGSGAGLIAGYWSGSRPIIDANQMNGYDPALLTTNELKDFVVPAFKEITADDMKTQSAYEALGFDFSKDWSWDDAAQNPKPNASAIEVTADEMTTIISGSGDHGAIEPAGNVLVKNGESQTFTFTPDEYFQTASVIIDGAENAEAVSNGSYTFTDVSQLHTISVNYQLRPDAGGTSPTVVSTEAAYQIGAEKHMIVLVDFGTGALGIIDDTRESVESCKIYDKDGNMIFDLDGCFWIPGAKYGRPDNELEICYDDMDKRPEYANLVPGEYSLEIMFKDLKNSTYTIPMHVTMAE